MYKAFQREIPWRPKPSRLSITGAGRSFRRHGSRCSIFSIIFIAVPLKGQRIRTRGRQNPWSTNSCIPFSVSFFNASRRAFFFFLPACIKGIRLFDNYYWFRIFDFDILDMVKFQNQNEIKLKKQIYALKEEGNISKLANEENQMLTAEFFPCILLFVPRYM